MRTRSEVFDDPIDTGHEGTDVIGIDNLEHYHEQLVATQLPVQLSEENKIREVF